MIRIPTQLKSNKENHQHQVLLQTREATFSFYSKTTMGGMFLEIQQSIQLRQKAQDILSPHDLFKKSFKV